jgi:membrane protease YdiL (CAAX protease family)
MKETFQNLIAYLKNPILEKDSNESLNYRFKIFFQILLISIATSFAITPIFIIIEALSLVNMENHKVEAMFENMPIYQIILIAGIVIPIIEEAIFRGPITAFKKPKNFRIAFYAFSLLFGFVHITNFDLTLNVFLLAPLLVLPQILLGGYFGYLRVRFGILWSMLLHGCYNGILITMSFYFK